MLASIKKNRVANFAHGFLLHEGKNIERDIEGAVHYYKEASSFNIQYAKNNLGILYKNGFGNVVKKNAANAIVYFEEAIRQKGDTLSMYNLAHTYIYDNTIKQDIDKSIELLIKSSKQFRYSFYLLCIALMKKQAFNMETILNEFKKHNIEDKDLALQIIEEINNLQLYDNSSFESLYESFRKIDFLYNISIQPILSSHLDRIAFNKPKYPNIKNITTEFYVGFGHDLLND